MIDKLQLIVALVWPLLKWVVAIDVTWQFARMLYFWQTPGVHAGWVFLGHFSVLV
ncbi:MAG TPA: KleE stable inheritance protein, partial [Variovorax sp.]|nr:KleE stable inheritance protein [Variovorax sp.]